MAERLDVFQTLNAIDKKDTDYYNNLTPELKKGFAPVVVNRWLSGTYSKQQVFLLNEIVNPYVFSLYKHPDLLYHLMTICTTGKPQRYSWNKTKPSNTNNPICVKIIEEYFKYNTEDATNAVQLLHPHDIILMAEELGWQSTEINKARKELGLQTVRSTNKTPKGIDIDLLEI